jgi:primosomal protein N' (replication factor Y)
MIQRKPAFQKVVSALHRPDSPQTIIATYETAYSLPLPPLGLIAMIEPDQALYYPDYQARERLWRTLHRFGAKLKPSGVLSVQTFEPESALWTTWVSQKQALTATELLAERKMLCYPPYFNLIQLECYPRKTMTSHASAEQTESLLRQATLASDVQVLPKYLPFNRKNRYHILIRYPRLQVLPPTLQKCLLALDSTIRLTHNPISLLG